MYNILSKSSVLALNCHLVICYQYSYSLKCMGAPMGGGGKSIPPLKTLSGVGTFLGGLPCPSPLTKFSASAYVGVHS